LVPVCSEVVLNPAVGSLGSDETINRLDPGRGMAYAFSGVFAAWTAARQATHGCARQRAPPEKAYAVSRPGSGRVAADHGIEIMRAVQLKSTANHKVATEKMKRFMTEPLDPRSIGL
jgi:hypothetical protein